MVKNHGSSIDGKQKQQRKRKRENHGKATEIGNQLGIRGERDTDWKTFILERLVFMRSYSSWRKSHQPAVRGKTWPLKHPLSVGSFPNKMTIFNGFQIWNPSCIWIPSAPFPLKCPTFYIYIYIYMYTHSI